MQKIIIAGDVHADFEAINTLISTEAPDILLVAGDFGWWPKFVEMTVEAKNTKVYWAPGNHEDWWDLRDNWDDKPAPCEMAPNVFYMKKGSTLELDDGRVILFMGGADSVDKDYLTLGHDWFPEEIINQADLHDLMTNGPAHVDIIVSHTCPLIFKKQFPEERLDNWYNSKFQDPSCLALESILHRYQPDLWYFGHFHFSYQQQYMGTTWTALNKNRHSGWWKWMPERNLYADQQRAS